MYKKNLTNFTINVVGSCNDHVNAFQCHCRPGYNGKKCENNINDCLSNPCINDGNCIDRVGDYMVSKSIICIKIMKKTFQKENIG